MRDWERYVEQQEAAGLTQWIDELSDGGMLPEDIASTIIEDGTQFVPSAMFDAIVEYVEQRRKDVAATREP